MSLPKIITPRIPVTLPKSEEKLVIRQMLTKEYKAIMSAINTDDTAIFLRTIADVINECVVEPSSFNVNKCAAFEVEYLFLQIYAASIKGDIEVSLRCTNPVDKPEMVQNELGILVETGRIIKAPCDTSFDIAIPINDVEVSEFKNSTFDIGNGIIIKLKYPDWQTMLKLIEENEVLENSLIDYENDEEYEKLSELERRRLIIEQNIKREEETNNQTLKLIYSCIDEIWVGDEKHDEAFTVDEFMEWIVQFPIESLNEIAEFVQTTPQITYTKEVVCPNCGNRQIVTLVGLNDFLK